MAYRRLEDYLIRRMADDLTVKLIESGMLKGGRSEKLKRLVKEIAFEYEDALESLAKKARALVDQQIENFPGADYGRAFQLAFNKLAEKEGLPTAPFEKSRVLARRIINNLEKHGMRPSTTDRAVRLASDILLKWFEVHEGAVREAEAKVASSRSDPATKKQLFQKYYREAVDRINH